jgi:hypothetical protein
VREQDRTLEREHSIYGFHKQVNLVEQTWNDDLRAVSYGLGIAIVVLPTAASAGAETTAHLCQQERAQARRAPAGKTGEGIQRGNNF